MKRIVLLLAALLAYAGLAFAAINVNTATKEQLEVLNGIGPVKAQAIIDYRTKNGPFKSVDDLKKVNGIGDATLEKIRGDVSLSGATNVPAAPAAEKKADAKPAAAPAAPAPAAPAPAAKKADAKPAAAPPAPVTAAEKKEAAKPAMADAKSENKAGDTKKTDKPGTPPAKTVDEKKADATKEKEAKAEAKKVKEAEAKKEKEAKAEAKKAKEAEAKKEEAKKKEDAKKADAKKDEPKKDEEKKKS